MNKQKFSFIALGVAILGLFFPWASAQTIFGEIHVNGIDSNDGKVHLVILALAVLLLWFRKFVLTLILCALGIGLSIYDMFDIMGGSDKAKEQGIIVSLGFGLFVTFAGFCAAACLVALYRRETRVIMPGTPSTFPPPITG